MRCLGYVEVISDAGIIPYHIDQSHPTFHSSDASKNWSYASFMDALAKHSFQVLYSLDAPGQVVVD